MKNKKIFRSVGVANRIYISYISKELERKELSYSDSIFLINIGDREGITQEEIAKMLAIDKAAVARSVKRMKQMNYVITSQAENDKREKKLHLTKEGVKIYKELLMINQKWIDYVLQDLSNDEKNRLEDRLEKMCIRAKEFNKI